MPKSYSAPPPVTIDVNKSYTATFETPRGTWHTLLSGSDGAAFLEIKEGPYDPTTAAEFAPWAPPEGHESVPAFQQWLWRAQPGSAAYESGAPDSQ